MRVNTAKDLADAVKRARTAQGLTQGQLAGACGTGVRFIVDLEKGKPTCEIERTIRVLSMLGITIELSSSDL